MNKSELLTFVLANSATFVILSIIFMVAFVFFLTAKTRKINETLDNCSKLVNCHLLALQSFEQNSYTINKHNQATLEFLKEIRKILIAHKGQAFDTQLLKVIDDEMQAQLNRAKYSNIRNFEPKESSYFNPKVQKQGMQKNINTENTHEITEVSYDEPFIEKPKKTKYLEKAFQNAINKVAINVKNSIDSIKNVDNSVENVDNFDSNEKNVVPQKDIYCIGNPPKNIKIKEPVAKEEIFYLKNLKGWNKEDNVV